MDPNTQTQFQTWLNSGSESVREMRKVALKAALEHLGSNRVNDCTPQQTVEIMAALGLPKKGDYVEAQIDMASGDVTVELAEAPSTQAPVPLTFSFDNPGLVDMELVLRPEQTVTLVARGYTIRVAT